jgi:hypothetical protein
MKLFIGRSRSRERSYPGAARFYREKGKLAG